MHEQVSHFYVTQETEKNSTAQLVQTVSLSILTIDTLPLSHIFSTHLRDRVPTQKVSEIETYSLHSKYPSILSKTPMRLDQ